MHRRLLILLPSILVLSFVSSPANASYALGSKLKIKLGCPSVASSDPIMTLRLTNLGTTTVVVSRQEPISIMAHLTVTDEDGMNVAAVGYDAGTRSMYPFRFLAAGDSLMLEDWVDYNKPPTDKIPLHVLGYKLKPGTYEISAKATNSPTEPQSNACTVVII